jgi:hypothetical protein
MTDKKILLCLKTKEFFGHIFSTCYTMIKNTFIFFLFFFFATSATAQLKNSRWLATPASDTTRRFTLDFDSDSAVLRSLDSTIFEKMSFKIDHSKLVLQKVIGSTLCSNEDVVLYDFKLNGNKMETRLVSDPCGQRSLALSGNWIKQQ